MRCVGGLDPSNTWSRGRIRVLENVAPAGRGTTWRAANSAAEGATRGAARRDPNDREWGCRRRPPPSSLGLFMDRYASNAARADSSISIISTR